MVSPVIRQVRMQHGSHWVAPYSGKLPFRPVRM
nr:MAG TPA: hypothetical protein [Caudoviricetes sp.]